MPTPTAAELAARLDRLPSSRYVWNLVILISLGACFEFYDLFLTAYVVPGMAKEGLFTPQSLGIFGVLAPLKVAGPGTFVFALFAGLWVGTMAFGWVSDAYGRRFIFTFSLVWYCISTLIMALQTTGFGIDLWRFIAGIGIGVELVTIDTYVSELIPRHARGRAFALNQFIAFCAVPVVAFLAYVLGPQNWRWVVVIGAIGAIFVWWLRLGVPESPRWLAHHGRLAEAETIIARIEERVQAEHGTLPPVGAAPPTESGHGNFGEIWHSPYGGRAIVLSVFNFFQTFGYYGFAAWVPTLLIAKGINITTSLEYAFIIAIANPIGPLLCSVIGERMERKWQICCAALGIGAFGLAFAWQTESRPADPVRRAGDAEQQLAVLRLPRLPGGAFPHPHPFARNRLRLFLEPVVGGILRPGGGILPDHRRRDGGVWLHRRRDGDRDRVDWRLRPPHQQPCAGSDLERVNGPGRSVRTKSVGWKKG